MAWRGLPGLYHRGQRPPRRPLGDERGRRRDWLPKMLSSPADEPMAIRVPPRIACLAFRSSMETASDRMVIAKRGERHRQHGQGMGRGPAPRQVEPDWRCRPCWQARRPRNTKLSTMRRSGRPILSTARVECQTEPGEHQHEQHPRPAGYWMPSRPPRMRPDRWDRQAVAKCRPQK